MAPSDTALTLNCISTSSPVTNVIWRKDGYSLVNDSSYVMTQVLTNGITATYDNLLSIDAPPSELIGEYSCIVHDSLGRNSGTSNIQLNGKKESNQIQNTVTVRGIETRIYWGEGAKKSTVWSLISCKIIFSWL